MKILDEAGNRVSSLDTIVSPGVVVVGSTVLWFVDRFCQWEISGENQRAEGE